MNYNALYVDTPFCVDRCLYCPYFRAQGDDVTVREYFTEYLPRLIEKCHDDLFSRDYHEMYFGGGTPTIACAELWPAVYDKLPMDRTGILLTESAPSTLTRDHVKLWNEYAFDFASIGVQTFNDDILIMNNRPPVEAGQVALLGEFNKYTNIDLICGIGYGDADDVGQTVEDVRFVMDRFSFTYITIHINYCVNPVNSYLIRKELIPALKDVVAERSDWEPCNHTLELSESDLDFETEVSVEYRLSKDADPDFLFRMIGCIPECPEYPFRIWNLYAEEEGLVYLDRKHADHRARRKKYLYEKRQRRALHLPFY